MLTLEHRAAAVSSETVQLVLTVFSLLSMLILITFCSRCRLLKNRSSAENGDFASPPVYDDAPDCVQFRNPAAIVRDGERHSQPAAVKGKHSRFDNVSSRASAPSQMGRALPRVPADVYATIDKTRTSQIAFADEGCNALYESLDPDQDSTLEKPYNKVADLMHTRERKYDYPVFSANKVFSGRSMPEDPTYNNGSQIYTVGGSDDPYRYGRLLCQNTCRQIVEYATHSV
ncbi:unnamed protein product [Heligmosomoides polygyrus]|uniref:Cadherin_C domain-containing protein n=1 Tax=Heligmosomoides polygyrus TaxID=6339 RepID=A0A183FZZ2_HELPZ|nr:unnamed protein product [Heligmosomoides polygyrus]